MHEWNDLRRLDHDAFESFKRQQQTWSSQQDWAESKRARLVHTGFRSKKNVASNH